MTLIIKSLADGQLPATTGTLYIVPASTRALIKTIKVVNLNTIAETINLYLEPSGGTARCIIPKNLSLGIGYLLVVDDELTLEAGDKLQGSATDATMVDYTISGVEEL